VTALFTSKDWEILIRAISDGRCTPFLGAGVNAGVFPLGKDIAIKWAAKYGYPLKDSDNLIRVAQFLAVEYYPMYPKDEVIRLYQEVCEAPRFSNNSAPLNVLAELPLSVYLTTNYDEFMSAALKRKYRDPKRELCRWNTLTRAEPSRFDKDYDPSPANPVVFHLHGHVDTPSSIVVTEDDYFDFLVNISRDESLLPKRIQKSLVEASVLFIGYGLADWNFRVLLQGLYRFMEKGLGRHHFAVMIPPGGNSKTQKEKIQKYLTAYYQNIDVRVFWGTATEFCDELSRQWKKSQQVKRK
jgi:hypothetical protein